MTFKERIRWIGVGILGRMILWLWAKSTRMKIIGEADYREVRRQGKPVIFLVWHGRIFIVPYFFRKRRIMPLISPSKDGEIASRIMSRWGYRILRGSGSHAVVNAWKDMKKELLNGGQLIIVTDGPRGPALKLKSGCLKLAMETGAYLVPFSFTTSRKKFLNSWDRFLIFYPFSKVTAVYGTPFSVKPDMDRDEFEKERLRIEHLMIEFEREVDCLYA